MANILKCKWIGLFLASVIMLSCDNDDNGPDKQVNVILSSPTVEPDGSLSLNATARFDAEIMDMVDSLPLIYEWSLQETRGTLVVENQDQGDQTHSSDPSVLVRGDRAGEETIRVKVLNEETGNSLGEDFLSFEITEPTGVSSCFDEPLLFFRNNNWDSPVVTAIGLESDTRKTTHLSPQNWLFDFTKNGHWFLRQDYSDQTNYEIWMDACDGSESKKLAEGAQIYNPTFGPNDKYVYYSELISYPQQVDDPRARELVRVNIETGEKVFISNLGVFSGKPKVSPDGKWIAFEHSRETFKDNGSYAGSIIHLAVMPSEGGPARFLVPIVDGQLGGIDWSPDSKDIIFYFNEFEDGAVKEGINRVYLDGGGSASFIHRLGEKGNGLHEVAYYANGTRIAFEGHPSGNDTQYDIWSIDANGSDLQRLTDEKYNVFLQFVWEP